MQKYAYPRHARLDLSPEQYNITCARQLYSTLALLREKSPSSQMIKDVKQSLFEIAGTEDIQTLFASWQLESAEVAAGHVPGVNKSYLGHHRCKIQAQAH